MSRDLTICAYVYVVAAALVSTAVIFGQDTQPPSNQQQLFAAESPLLPPPPELAAPPDLPPTPSLQPAKPDRQPEPVVQAPQPVVPQMGRRPSSSRRKIPAAQYSPLAAAGGYSRGGVSFWQSIVNYFNPRQLNFGQIWEQARQNWQDNAANNPFFWYALWVTLAVMFSLFAVWWIHQDRMRETGDLAEDVADALRYSEYCKRQAKAAIGKYNQHMETCNRLVEAAASGMVTPETVNISYQNKELTRLKNENHSKAMQLERLQAELDEKSKQLSDFSKRLDDAELQPKGGAALSELAERINRLERENAKLAEVNRRLRLQAKQNESPRYEDASNGDQHASGKKAI